jgi:RNA polymerase sigma-70 factor (ECF subfamily)
MNVTFARVSVLLIAVSEVMAKGITEISAGAYPSTVWTEVALAGRCDCEASLAALEQVLQTYYKPLRAHLMRCYGLSEPAASDLLHDFIHSKVLLKNLLGDARKDRGRFRTFLLNALNNFAVSEFRKNRAAKRFPSGGFFPIEDARNVPSDQADALVEPWAREVLNRTIALMRAECERQSCGKRWKVFEMRLLTPILDGGAPPAYEQVIASLGFQSPAEAANALTTAKRMFERMLRQVIAEYAGGEEALEQELRQLRLDLVRERFSSC